jgi:hypothetical protein
VVIRAFIDRDYIGWMRNTVRLIVQDGSALLMADGTWREFAEGESATDAGIVLPAAAVEAIAVAVADFQGHASHADTEARVLREWLAVEQRRVDAALTANR